MPEFNHESPCDEDEEENAEKSGRGKRAELTPKEFEVVAQLLVEGKKDNKAIAEQLKDDFGLKRSPRTIQNRRNEFNTTKQLILENIEGKYKSELESLKNTMLQTNLVDAQNDHNRGLFEFSQDLRGRIVDPQLYRRIAGSIWDSGGFNWRLTPFLWLDVATPYLDERGAYFGPKFRQLMAHLPDNKLVSHFDDLTEIIRTLNSQSETKLKTLKSKDPEWFAKWDRFEDRYLDSAFEEIELGGFSIPEIVPTIDAIFMSESAERLLSDAEQLTSRYDEAEMLLQDMWNDLDPDVIRAQIWLGHCERCSALV